MKKILGLILTLCMLCLLPSYMGKADIDEIINKMSTKEGYASLTNDEIDEYCSHFYPNLFTEDSGFGVNSEKITEKDRAWITKVYREALKSEIKAYRKYNKTFVKLSEKNKSNKGELYWYSDFMDTVPFIGDSLYLDNYLIGGDSKTINDIVDNTTYKIRDCGSTVNVYKSKKIYLQGDEIWLEKGDTSWYVIGIRPQEKGYLKGSHYYLKFNNDWNDDLYYKYIKDDYGNYDNIYTIKVHRPNDYVWKKTFSLKYAPSYENFEEEFRQKIKISDRYSRDIEIKQSSDSAYVYYTVIFPEISDVDVWYGIDAFKSVLGKYYRKYPRNKYPRKNKLLDMLVNYSDGSNCDYKRIEIRYAYSRKTRVAKEITFIEHDLWYRP